MKKVYVLNRKTYKDIKRKDHREMNDFCQRLYVNGYEDGKKDAEGLTETEIRQAILRVKGIGEKKTEAIMKSILEADKQREASCNG